MHYLGVEEFPNWGYFLKPTVWICYNSLNNVVSHVGKLTILLKRGNNTHNVDDLFGR
jgi:hypothetical protein